jgi:uncharacterized protein YcbX
VGQVVSVLRYPLKSAQGESLDEAGVEPGGLAGDRSWACLDAHDGTVVSAKHPRRWGRLLGVGAYAEVVRPGLVRVGQRAR